MHGIPFCFTPNFQRQHYLYWCNVYNLRRGCLTAYRTPPFEYGAKVTKKLFILILFKKNVKHFTYK